MGHCAANEIHGRLLVICVKSQRWLCLSSQKPCCMVEAWPVQLQWYRLRMDTGDRWPCGIGLPLDS